MKPSLAAGIRHHFTFEVPATKTVPRLYPESEEFRQMPEVFATGYLVGLLEWVCIQAVNPHLDWPDEQTVGIHVDVSHSAATPPGFRVNARVHLIEVQGRKLVFEVEADDGVDLIAKGRHERFVIDREKFGVRVKEKAAKRPA